MPSQIQGSVQQRNPVQRQGVSQRQSLPQRQSQAQRPGTVQAHSAQRQMQRPLTQRGAQVQRSAHGGYGEQPVARATSLLQDPVYYEEQAVEEVGYEDQYGQQYVEPEYEDDPYATQEVYQDQQYVDQQDYTSQQQQQYVEPEQYAAEEEYVEQETYQVDPQYSDNQYYEEDQLVAESLMEYAEQRHGLNRQREQVESRRSRFQDQNQGQNRGRETQRRLGANAMGRSQPSNRSGLLQEPSVQRRPGSTEAVKRQAGSQKPRAAPPSLLETPLVPPVSVHSDRRQRDPIQLAVALEASTQMEMMTKAELQMRLLEEEKIREMREMEQMNLLQQQQQALLLQQQQQQQQQLMQQQQQALLRMGPQTSKASTSIPSLFEISPTTSRTGKMGLGKRPGGPNRQMDNKRPRVGVSTFLFKVMV